MGSSPRLDADQVPDEVSRKPRHEIELAVDRINSCTETSIRDKQALEDGFELLCREVRQHDDFGGYTLASTVRYAHHTLREAGGLAWGLEGGRPAEASIDRIITFVSKRDVSPRTAEEHYKSVLLFAGVLTDGTRHEHPAPFDRLPRNLARDKDPTPKQTDIITFENAATIAETTRNERDRAMIMVQWATGGRPLSELHPLTFENIEDRGDHFLISFADDSKTGSRDIRLYVGAPQLRAWIDEHPAQDSEEGIQPGDPIWSQLGKNQRIHYNLYARTFRNAASEAGVTKTSTPRHYRASRASILAMSPFVNQADLENYFGWVRGSDMARRYIARFGGATQLHIARHDGVPVGEEDEPEPIVPVNCGNCSRWTPRYLDECMWCSYDVEASHDVTIDDLEQSPGEGDLLDMILDGEVEAEDLRGVKRVLPVIRARPDLLERVDEIISLLDRFEGSDST